MVSIPIIYPEDLDFQEHLDSGQLGSGADINEHALKVRPDLPDEADEADEAEDTWSAPTFPKPEE